MRILYVFPEELTGAFAREYHVYRLAGSLAAARCEVTLATARSGESESQEDLSGLFGGGTPDARLQLVRFARLLQLGPLKVRSGGVFYRQLDRLVGREKFDAVYTMHLKAAAHMKQRWPHLPLVFEAHEIFADSHPEGSAKFRELTELERTVYSHARAVVAISHYLGECLRSRYGVQQPLCIQHDGIDESMLLDAGKSDPRELIYAGSLQPWKGVPVAIEAMRLLPGHHLTIAGGSGEKLEALKRSAPDNVTFAGQLSRSALLPLLERAAIGLMPNLPEPRSALYTFPLKLLEYSAAGKGIVASHIPVFDHLDTGRWVKLVPSGSPQALAEAVQAFAGIPPDAAAAQNWAQQFLWPRQGETLRDFLASVIR